MQKDTQILVSTMCSMCVCDIYFYIMPAPRKTDEPTFLDQQQQQKKQHRERERTSANKLLLILFAQNLNNHKINNGINYERARFMDFIRTVVRR